MRMKIRNGYQKSAPVDANSRAKAADRRAASVEEDRRRHARGQAFGWQEIAVEQPAGPLEAVELRVRSVYAGEEVR